MSSRLMRGMAVGCAVCLGAALTVGGADVPPRTVPAATAVPNPFVSSTPTPFQFAPTNPGEQKPAKSSRIMFESTWKNVQIGSKPFYFRQGDKSFVWTVKNTGENTVEVGDDYGFSIAPGEEEYIIDSRLVLSVANEKTTTVEVKATRVMTQGELSTEPRPTPASAPTYAPPSHGPRPVPTYGSPATPTPADDFGSPKTKGERKPEPTSTGSHEN